MTETTVVTHNYADSELPRIDRFAVIDGEVKCLPGTPTEGATFENRWGLAPLPEGAVELEPLVLVAPGSSSIATEVVLPPAWHNEVNPSNAKVYAVRDWVDSSLDEHVPADRMHVYRWNAVELMVDFVANMGHADVLTAQRMAKEIQRCR